jgi:hypothetical protein
VTCNLCFFDRNHCFSAPPTLPTQQPLYAQETCLIPGLSSARLGDASSGNASQCGSYPLAVRLSSVLALVLWFSGDSEVDFRQVINGGSEATTITRDNNFSSVLESMNRLGSLQQQQHTNDSTIVHQLVRLQVDDHQKKVSQSQLEEWLRSSSQLVIVAEEVKPGDSFERQQSSHSPVASVRLTWHYDNHAYRARAIWILQQRFVALATQLFLLETKSNRESNLSTTPLKELDYVSVAEWDYVRRVLNGDSTLSVDQEPVIDHSTKQQSSSIVALFEAQVALAPNAIAITHELEEEMVRVEVSYAELNARANRLATFFRNEGHNFSATTNPKLNGNAPKHVRPGSLVALFFDRSVDLIVAILAVIKCGAYYLALEPENPDER